MKFRYWKTPRDWEFGIGFTLPAVKQVGDEAGTYMPSAISLCFGPWVCIWEREISKVTE